MFWNVARPPTASSVSFGLKPVAVTLMVTSLGTAGDGTGAVGAALLPHAATLSAKMQSIAIGQQGINVWQLDLCELRGTMPTDQNLSRTAN
jgi:hypothetical protein